MNKHVAACVAAVLVLALTVSIAQARQERSKEEPSKKEQRADQGDRARDRGDDLYARMAEVEGKTFYTAANIFYEKPEKINSTNYHKGKILPVGSKVTIVYAGGREIEFKDEKNTRFLLILKKKHTDDSMTLRRYFDQYFSAEDPLRPGGPYSALTDAEQWDIKNGIIEKGMSRAAVLMAYGYPPSHETPNLKADKWAYWIGSMHGKPLYVYFKDEHVYKIINEGKERD